MDGHGSGDAQGNDVVGSFQCTYTDCGEVFPTLKEMKTHKVKNLDHFYCKKCDVDCDSWEDLKQHKVRAMTPYLDSINRDPNDLRPPHITCEFCGMDFRSFGGRRIHREQMHKADQNIQCPAHAKGCSHRFPRAAAMIAHLEEGRCLFIKSQEFLTSVQHKHIVKLIMSQPDVFLAKLEKNRTSSLPENAQQPKFELRVPSPDNGESGVNLISLDDSSPPFKHKGELPATGGAQDDTDASARPAWPSLSDSQNVSSTGATATGEPVPWATSKTSRTLFGDAPPREQTGLEAADGEQAPENRRENMLYSQWYNPKSKDFDLRLFWNANHQLFICPFAGCDITCETRQEVENHLKEWHLLSRFMCSTCFKTFGTATSLVAHIETTSKCRIKYTTNYLVLLDEISGGFMTAQHVPLPELVTPKNGEGDAGEVGVASVQFKAQPKW
ncbi:hypothetical protein K470DRAFT_211469 [Piedraia hortae CBS 480.64]|uniref:C2H2-type domain-containing protein n=1 Tax=Piedraia hortae CBS 480.64 TaxID=1314780 RepID=A0A6A7C9E6_9PEZI|nr:hypothetical protein K470DRAFT_211469 [Piedraia hortae CBS 480.64]